MLGLIDSYTDTLCGCLCVFFFFFKQKTAYEMRISDWSSDVCSSDLIRPLSTQTDVDASVNPIMLEVFNNLFMSIADQMGVRLQNTAYSVNIKERQIGRASCRERVCQYV